MTRGLQLCGELIRSLRLTKGWSQLDLAQRAGVGERTIRNAESSKTVETSTASYIAGALEVCLDMLLKPPPPSHLSFSVSHFELAFREAFFERRIAPLQKMLTPNCLWRIIGIPRKESISIVHSDEQLTELFDSVRSYLPSQKTHLWKVNREDSVCLADTFTLVANYISRLPSSCSLRCNTIGTIKQHACCQVTQTWDEDVH